MCVCLFISRPDVHVVVDDDDVFFFFEYACECVCKCVFVFRASGDVGCRTDVLHRGQWK